MPGASKEVAPGASDPHAITFPIRTWPQACNSSSTNDEAWAARKSDPSSITAVRRPNDVAESELGKRVQGLGGKNAIDQRNDREKGPLETRPRTGRRAAEAPGREATPEGREGIRCFKAQEGHPDKRPGDKRKGTRVESKHIVRNADGIPMARMVSGCYNFNDMYGRTRAFGGTQHSSFSHATILFATPESVGKEIRSAGGPAFAHHVDEWEKKIILTQGRAAKLVPKEEAFRLDRLRGLDQGTGDYWWKTTPTKVASDRSDVAKEAQLKALRQEVQRLRAAQPPRRPISNVLMPAA